MILRFPKATGVVLAAMLLNVPAPAASPPAAPPGQQSNPGQAHQADDHHRIDNGNRPHADGFLNGPTGGFPAGGPQRELGFYV